MAVVVKGGSVQHTRIEVEFNQTTLHDLEEIIELDRPLGLMHPLTKSTAINRAVQMYAELMRQRECGGQVVVSHVGEDGVAVMSDLKW